MDTHYQIRKFLHNLKRDLDKDMRSIGPSEVRVLPVPALQTGCVANIVSTEFIIFTPLLSPPYYFSPIRGCPRVVKICVCTKYGKTR